MLRATASQRQLSLVGSDCICNHMHNAINVT